VVVAAFFETEFFHVEAEGCVWVGHNDADEA